MINRKELLNPNIETDVTDQIFEEASGSFNIVEHFEELRSRFFRIAIFLMISWGAGWFIQPFTYNTISYHVKSLLPPTIEYKEAFRGLMDPFMLKLKLSFIIGCFFTIPYVIGEAWFFISPGLKKKERKILLTIIPLSSAFFIAGSIICYFILPRALNWLIGFVKEFPDTYIYQEPGSLVMFFLKMIFIFGIAFQFPLILTYLVTSRILKYDTLITYWRHIIAGIFTVCMVINPSADPISMLVLALPLSLFFLLILGIGKLLDKQIKKI